MLIRSRAGIFFSTDSSRRIFRVASSRIGSVAPGDVSISMRRGASARVGLLSFPILASCWLAELEIIIASLWVDNASFLFFFNCCSFFSFRILKVVSARRLRPSEASTVFLKAPLLWSVERFPIKRNVEKSVRSRMLEAHQWRKLADESVAHSEALLTYPPRYSVVRSSWWIDSIWESFREFNDTISVDECDQWRCDRNVYLRLLSLTDSFGRIEKLMSRRIDHEQECKPHLAISWKFQSWSPNQLFQSPAIFW